jgi:hypothetical protein
MRLLDRLAARRRRKAHERYERERRRQEGLQGRDADDAVRDAIRGGGPGIGTPHNS